MRPAPEDLMNGLTPGHDLFFAQRPEDPAMRESTSIWLFEENGAFGFPRMGIEALSETWDERMYQANIAFADCRVLKAQGLAAPHDPLDSQGVPSRFGTGPLRFTCLEPFRRWQVTLEGLVTDGTTGQQIDGTYPAAATVPVRLEAELHMATPAWRQDNPGDSLAELTPEQAADAASMGVGWRFEHLFRARGELSIAGEVRDFVGLGSRIKRQSVRPLEGFRGHCWQSALFPDGRAFGYIAYPSSDGAEPLNEGYVYQDNVMYPARATRIPWLRRLVDTGDDVSLQLEYEHGKVQIGGRSCLSTYKILNPDMAALGAGGFNLMQSGAHYTWDGQSAYGMIERSALDEQMRGGAGSEQ